MAEILEPAPMSMNEPAQTPGAETAVPALPVSEFKGRTIQLIGWRLLGGLLTMITLGIFGPWAYCMVLRWETKHTYVNGKRLCFSGKGHQLLGRSLLWGLLTVVTCGIYGLFVPVRWHKWRASHTHFAKTDADVAGPSGGKLAIMIVAAALAVTMVVGLVVLLLPRATSSPDSSTGHSGFFSGLFSGIVDKADNLISFTPPQDDSSDVEEDVISSCWYANSPKGVPVYADRKKSAEVVAFLTHGTQVNVERQQGKWSYIGDGWCQTELLIQKYDTSPSIVGVWYWIVSLDDYRFGPESYYIFNPDGTYERGMYGAIWEYDPITGAVQEEVSYDREPTEWGTYTYDGDVLTLNTTRATDSSEALPYVSVYDDTFIYNNTLLLGHGWKRGTPEELAAEMFGPPLGPLDSAIFGEWNHFCFDEGGINLQMDQTYCFLDDGTYTLTFQETYYWYNYKTEDAAGAYYEPYGVFTGVYSFDGTTLILDRERTLSIRLVDGILYIDGEAYYQGDPNAIAQTFFGLS